MIAVDGAYLYLGSANSAVRGRRAWREAGAISRMGLATDDDCARPTQGRSMVRQRVRHIG
jgi:hypothetical protein